MHPVPRPNVRDRSPYLPAPSFIRHTQVTAKLVHDPVARPPSPSKSARPKAKVNSAATPIRKTPSQSPVAPSRPAVSRPASVISVTPRAASPVRPPTRAAPTSGALSPTFHPRTRPISSATARPLTPKSTPATPEPRFRSLTTVSDAIHTIPRTHRPRQGSLSLHHATSFSSLQHSTDVTSRSGSPQFPPEEPLPAQDSQSPPLRIKSKVSGLAKPSSNESPSSSPLLPSSRPALTRTRAPSISSSVSLQSSSPPPPTFYPITTATPAANPHRFAPNRPTVRQQFQPFQSPQAVSTDAPPYSIVLVDPALVPLPSNSPPASAVSFSSHSSVSRSSAEGSASFVLRNGKQAWTTAKTVHDPTYDQDRLNGLDVNHHRDSGDEESDRDLKVKTEAKTVRKIADLEITNRSLLAINASLETAKHRQAKEIRELKRKLRESRLILPPRTYRAVKSSLEPEAADDEEEDDDDEDEEHDDDHQDEVYVRIKAILESLIRAGKRALETKVEDFAISKGGAKVLSAEEVRSWRDSGDGDLDPDQTDNVNDPPSPSPLTIPVADEDLNSEEEVEAMTLPRNTPSPSPTPPPILITHSF